MAKTISKISAVAFCFVCLMVFSTYGTSYANVTCNVKVESVYMTAGGGGTQSSGVLVALKNTTGATLGTNWANNGVRSFYLYKPLGNQGMAVLLTALSNKTKVLVNIAGDAANASLIMFVAVTQLPQ